jgi:hypothetical protein
MSNKTANRRSPSGPAIAEQLPYGNVQPVSGANEIVSRTGVGSVALGSIREAEYEIPVAGKLSTLQVRNNPVGADPALVTYQVLKNGGPVGDPVIIANNAVGPVKVNLSTISVLPGDLIAISMTAAAFGGPAPWARVLLTYIPSTSAP